MEAFLNMGGHGGYIWPAYGIVAVVLVALFVASRRFVKSTAAELDGLNPRARRKQGKDNETQA